MTLAALRHAYAAGRIPEETLAEVAKRLAGEPRKSIWITRASSDHLAAQLATLGAKRQQGPPLPL